MRFFKIFIILIPVLAISCTTKVENTNDKSNKQDLPNYQDSSQKYKEIYDTIYIKFALNQSNYRKALDLFIRDINIFHNLKIFRKMSRISIDLQDEKSSSIIVDRWLELDNKDPLAYSIGMSAALESSNLHKANSMFNGYLNLMKTGEKRSFYSRLMHVLSENKNKSNVIRFFDNYLKKKDDRELTINLITLLDNFNHNTKVLEYINRIGTANDRNLIRYKANSLAALNRTEKAINILTEYLASKEIPDREIQLELIRLHLFNKNKKAAEIVIDDIKTKVPENIEILYRIAVLAYSTNSLDIAEKYLSQVLAVGYMQNNVNYILGLIDYKKTNYLEAIRHFEKVTEGDNAFESLIRKAFSINKISGLKTAIKYLDTLVDNNLSNNLRLRIILAKVTLYHEENKFEKIILLVDKSSKLYSKNTQLIYAKAMAYESLKNIENMEEGLKEILELDSKNSIALNALGYSLLIHTERLDEAETYIKKALEYDPENPAILDSFAWLLFNKDNFKDALPFIELAYNKDQDPEIVEHFCKILIKNGFYEKSKKIMETEINKNPDNKQLVNILTNIHSDVPL